MVLSHLIAESEYELADSTRWKKARFTVENGQNWKGPRIPERVDSHIKRLVFLD